MRAKPLWPSLKAPLATSAASQPPLRYRPGTSVLPAPQISRTHSIPVANVHLRSHFPHLLELYARFVTHAAYGLGIPVSKPIPLPVKRTIWTLPRSPFVFKKAQENFERKVHKRAIKAWDADPEVVHRWIKYLEMHTLGGVGMRFVTWHRVSVGFGEQYKQDVFAAMKLDKPSDREKVEILSKKIIELESSASSVPVKEPASHS